MDKSSVADQVILITSCSASTACNLHSIITTKPRIQKNHPNPQLVPLAVYATDVSHGETKDQRTEPTPGCDFSPLTTAPPEVEAGWPR